MTRGLWTDPGLPGSVLGAEDALASAPHAFAGRVSARGAVALRANAMRSTQENLEVAHHLQELVAIHARVALAVDLADHVLDLLFRQVFSK